MRFGIVKRVTEVKKTSLDTVHVTTSDGQSTSTHTPLGPEEYEKLENSIGYTFKDKNWLERALTHRSAPQDGTKNDYERLEFLGDAVFDLSVAHLLSDKHPEAREGELSKMRAALVNTVSLSELAKKMNLGAYIKLGRGEIASGGHERASILADVLEALIGAVYRDSGYDTAFVAVTTLFGEQIESVTPRDPKTELQEVLHAIGSEAPNYLLECVEGPEHAPTFVSIVEVDGEIVGRGRGATKKASQQEAASLALTKLKPIEEEMKQKAAEAADTVAVEASVAPSNEEQDNI
ncbi:MAG: ribonuclease III [bacterium]|nr:ribonuclease III [bacterium]